MYTILEQSDNHTMVGPMDVHCWVINPDGTLYDPEFKQYKTIQSKWGCTNHKVMQPFTSEKRNEVWHMLWKTSILPQFNASGKDATLEFFYQNPHYGYCYFNAYAYHLRTPGSKMIIGRMGWKKKGLTNNIHWEFG